VGIVGPSGSGKTTLLRTILEQVDRYAGEVVRHPRAGLDRVRIGYVPQVETVDWNFPITVEQVVLLGRWRESGWRPWPRRQDRRLVEQVLDRLGIAHLGKRPIRALSGGQQQRAFLARALIGDPDLLLLDEPTSGVDIKTRHEVMHLLGELNRAGTTVVMTTHDLNAVATHLPRLVCIGEGFVIADGRPPEVLTPPVLKQAYGAEMLVLRRGRTVYVVEHPDGDAGVLPFGDATAAPTDEEIAAAAALARDEAPRV
jgi:zinc/manganese transport system ATP-binding protein/zinc transport system ATP-binding protein